MMRGRARAADTCRTWQELVAARWAITRERILGALISMVPAGGMTTELAWSFIAGLYVVDFALRVTTTFLILLLVAVLRVPYSTMRS